MSLADSAWIPLWLDPPQSTAWFGTGCLSLLAPERPSSYCTSQTLLSHWCAAVNEACTLSGERLAAETAISYHLSDGSGFLSWPLLLVKAHWSGPARVPFPWEKSLICLQVTTGRASQLPISLKVLGQGTFFWCIGPFSQLLTHLATRYPSKYNKCTCTLFGINLLCSLSVLCTRNGRI